MPVPPRSVTSRATSSTADRPVTYTVAPHSPSTTAMPRPTPRVEPVTTATAPLRSGACQLDDGNDDPDHHEHDQHDLHPQPPRRKVPHDGPLIDDRLAERDRHGVRARVGLKL